MPSLRSTSKIVRDGYLKVTNPDSIPYTKVNSVASRVSSGEKQVVFGSFDAIEPLTVEGELIVLVGTPLNEQVLTILNTSITSDTTLYGPVNVDSPTAVDIGATVTIL